MTTEFRAGDRVRVTYETTVRDNVGVGTLRILHPIEHSGTTIVPVSAVKLIPEPLPTEPGAYLDNDGDFWIVNASGVLQFVAFQFGGLANSDTRANAHPASYGPFTPLIPKTEATS